MLKLLRNGALVACAFGLAGCAEKPPHELPWSSTAEYTLRIVSADYDVSRFWRCGWNGACPEKTWSYCLHVVPHTQEAAVEWYRRLHSREFREVSEGRGDLLIEHLPASIARLEARVEDDALSAPERAEVADEIRQLTRTLEERTRFRGELTALERGDAAFAEEIFRASQTGLHVEAAYRVSLAGTPNQREYGYYFTGSCTPQG